MAGEGEAGIRGGSAGDLYVFITIEPHPIFKREGANIYCKVPIPMTIAALSGAIEVPVLDGTRAKVTIPAGTQTNDQFRLRDKGMPVMQSSKKGDMYIIVSVETPVNLSKKQKELLEAFAAEDGDHSPASSGFFAKVKDIWGDFRDGKAK